MQSLDFVFVFVLLVPPTPPLPLQLLLLLLLLLAMVVSYCCAVLLFSLHAQVKFTSACTNFTSNRSNIMRLIFCTNAGHIRHACTFTNNIDSIPFLCRSCFLFLFFLSLPLSIYLALFVFVSRVEKRRQQQQQGYQLVCVTDMTIIIIVVVVVVSHWLSQNECLLNDRSLALVGLLTCSFWSTMTNQRGAKQFSSCGG